MVTRYTDTNRREKSFSCMSYVYLKFTQDKNANFVMYGHYFLYYIEHHSLLGVNTVQLHLYPGK